MAWPVLQRRVVGRAGDNTASRYTWPAQPNPSGDRRLFCQWQCGSGAPMVLDEPVLRQHGGDCDAVLGAGCGCTDDVRKPCRIHWRCGRIAVADASRFSRTARRHRVGGVVVALLPRQCAAIGLCAVCCSVSRAVGASRPLCWWIGRRSPPASQSVRQTGEQARAARSWLTPRTPGRHCRLTRTITPYLPAATAGCW